MIVFHIGLPKTATTYLQHRIFKPAYKDNFFHRSTPVIGEHVKELRTSIQNRRLDFNSLNKRTMSWLSSLARVDNGLLSDENISSTGRRFWDGSGVSAEEVCNDLVSLRNWMGVSPDDFRVILGIREQDQFLASRYAQSAYEAFLKSNLSYSQNDFERKIDYILQKGNSLPAFSWLYYVDVKRIFEQYFNDCVYIYNMDDLKQNPSRTLRNIGIFCNKELVDPLTISEKNRKSSITRKIGDNKWSLGGDRTLVLDEDLADTLKRHFAEHLPFRASRPVEPRQGHCVS